MKNQPNIYISCPMNVDYRHLEDVVFAIEHHTHIKPNWWNRMTYVSNCVDECDIFVLILPNNKFNSEKVMLPIGCRKELELAEKLGKKVFIAYRSTHGINIYKTNITNRMIEAIAGTTAEFHGECLNLTNKSNTMEKLVNYGLEYISINTTKPDSRLLLLM